VTGVILAHQGGWDEILMVLGPVIVIVALLRLAKQRVERRGSGTPDATSMAAPGDDRGTRSTRG
jgi:hypothetical protein